MTDETVPQLTIACGISQGAGKTHGEALAVVQLQKGAPVLVGGGPALGPVKDPEAAWLIVFCSKHGGLMASEAEMLAALQRGQTAIHVTRRSRPEMRLKK